MVVGQDIVIISKNPWEKKMSEGQYLRDKVKTFEIHWDVVKTVNDEEAGCLIYSIKY